VRLVKIGSERFLDVVPAENRAVTFPSSPILGYVPVHSVLRVLFDRKTLWLTDSRDPGASSYYHGTGDQTAVISICKGYSPNMLRSGKFLLTAPTEVLVDLLTKHAREGLIFPRDNEGDFRLRIAKSEATK
jgi:hypothetical protein